MRQTVTVSSATQSDPIRIDSNLAAFGLGALLEFTGTATATVEYTFDKPNTDPNNATAATDNWTGANWIDISDLTSIVATDTSAKIDANVEGVRIDCTAYTSGDINLKIIQGYKT